MNIFLSSGGHGLVYQFGVFQVELTVLTSPTLRYLTRLDSSTHSACDRLFFRIQRV
ncbi:hypothetical protein H6G93_31970 [Nostoc sp. FACHB-973]|nr:hypothetical protein [Nostoc sp. FACHB-973]